MDEHHTALRANGRAIIVGTVLILSHLVDIQPSEVTGFGLKLGISDPAIIRGAIAVVFLHYYVMALVDYPMRAYRPKSIQQIGIMKEAWTRAKRLPNVGFPQKQFAKGWFTFIWGGLRVHALILAGISLIAFIFAVIDLVFFAKLIALHAIN